MYDKRDVEYNALICRDKCASLQFHSLYVAYCIVIENRNISVSAGTNNVKLQGAK